MNVYRTPRSTKLRQLAYVIRLWLALAIVFSLVLVVVFAQDVALLATTLVTEKPDYAPGELVTVTGSGFTPNTQYALPVKRPDGSIVVINPVTHEIVEGWAVVSADGSGGFVYEYQLNGIPGQYEARAYPHPWGGNWDDAPVASVTFTDAPEPASTITKSASPLLFSSAGTVINYVYLVQNTGNVTLIAPFSVVDDKALVVCTYPADLAPDASFACSGSYEVVVADVTAGYVANKVYATGTYGGNTITSNTDEKVATTALTCEDDTSGANDEPGQKDMTRFCTVQGTYDPLVVAWNWDVISMPGTNTADACALFDSNGNGYANYALCVTWDNTRHQLTSSPVLYTCTADDRFDRCAGADTGTSNVLSVCGIDLDVDDPFNGTPPPNLDLSPGDSYPQDTKARCAINRADVPAGSEFLDVCSYPSAQPNSAPADCVQIPEEAFFLLEVKKAIVPSSDGGLFDLQIDGTTYCDDCGHGGTTGEKVVLDWNHTVGEVAGLNTDLSSYTTDIVCRDLNGTGAMVASCINCTSLAVTGADNKDIVCTITNNRKLGSLKVTKTVNWNGVTPDTTQTFQICITGPSYPTTANCKTIDYDGGNLTWTGLIPGNYTVNETNPGVLWDVTITGSPATVPSCGGQALAAVTNKRLVPKIDIDKQVSADAGVTWHNAVQVAAGDQVHYRFLVKNTGDVPLSDVSVTDPTLGQLLFGDPNHVFCEYAALAIGEQVTCGPFGPWTVTEFVNSAPKVNTATACGNYWSYRVCDSDKAWVFPETLLTDTSYCPLPNNQFRLNFNLQAASSTYRLQSSNPGQFYFNAFYTGVPGSDFTMYIQIPYPFVTQEGAGVPIQVHDGTNVNGSGCFEPNPMLYGYDIATQDDSELSSSGQPIITFADYTTKQMGQYTTVTVSGQVPATGLVYVTIHLDYGLKKTRGWQTTGTTTQNPVTGKWVADVRLPAAPGNNGNGPVTIHGYEVYSFARTVGGDTSTTTPSSYNELKKTVGALGWVTDAISYYRPKVAVKPNGFALVDPGP